MGSFTRIISYVAVFICFLIGALALQNWLQRQTQTQLRTMNASSIAAKRQQLQQAFASHGLKESSSFEAFRDSASSVGIKLDRVTAAENSSDIDDSDSLLHFDVPLSETLNARASFPRSPAAKLISIYHRVTLGLLLLGPVLFGFGLLIASIGRSSPKEDRGSRPPWASTKSNAVSFEEIAKFSNDRSRAYEEAQAARRRIAEDLEVNRSLLDRSLDERIRLGRELHDNICQTLYAVCLTLESVQKKNSLAPELSNRVEQCMTELKRVNREVRAYLQELEPASVHGGSFDGALRELITNFPRDERVQIESRLDSETTARIPTGHIAEIMNITREAISNAVRHGGADKIVVRTGGDEHEVALSIQDNGKGFVSGPNRSVGHGLTNMKTRATELGGTLEIDSTPGSGTRVIIRLPLRTIV